MSRIPRLTAISRRSSHGSEGFGRWLEALARAGVDAIQIREKELRDRELLDLVERAVETVAGRARVIVNGRADVAVAAGAHGVHLPADGLPAEALRSWLGPDLLIGCSTHTLEEIDKARAAGADYAYFSPVFETPGKSPVGIGALRRATGRGLPVIALGGITIDRLEAVAGAGAAGAAAIRMFAGPDQLASVVAAGRRAFQS